MIVSRKEFSKEGEAKLAERARKRVLKDNYVKVKGIEGYSKILAKNPEAMSSERTLKGLGRDVLKGDPEWDKTQRKWELEGRLRDKKWKESSVAREKSWRKIEDDQLARASKLEGKQELLKAQKAAPAAEKIQRGVKDIRKGLEETGENIGKSARRELHQLQDKLRPVGKNVKERVSSGLMKLARKLR